MNSEMIQGLVKASLRQFIFSEFKPYLRQIAPRIRGDMSVRYGIRVRRRNGRGLEQRNRLRRCACTALQQAERIEGFSEIGTSCKAKR
jgi:hypothetical protein